MSDPRALAATSPADDEARRRALWWTALLAVAALLRLVLARRYDGFLTGDDVEILETGLRPVLGLAYRAWEIRDPFVAWTLVTPATWIAHASGVDSVRDLVWIASWPFVALSLANLALVGGLARRWGGGPGAALLAALLYASHWIPAGFATMTYPRTASTTCVLAAATLASGRRRGAAFAAGALVAVAFAVRYSEIVFAAPVALALVVAAPERSARSRRLLAFGLGGACGAALAAGVVDLVAWGRPFASLLAFARYTLIEGRASSLVAHQPVGWYLWRLPHWIAPTALPALALSGRAATAPRPRAVAWSFVLLPVLALSFVHHKDLRYLQGVLPFVAVLCAAGFVELAGATRRWIAISLVALTIAWGLAQLDFLAGKSMAAVDAARAIAADPEARVVAAVQPWALGDRLYLPPRIALRELPTPIAPAALARGIAAADRVVLYEQDLTRDPRLAEALAAAGFRPARLFARDRSRTVRVFARPAPAPSAPSAAP